MHAKLHRHVNKVMYLILSGYEAYFKIYFFNINFLIFLPFIFHILLGLLVNTKHLITDFP